MSTNLDDPFGEEGSGSSPVAGAPEDYAVGYKKPPKQHQFKKGSPSPNPSGRPKRQRSVEECVERQLAKRVRIKEHGKWVWLTKRDLLVAQLVNKAVMGDAAAVKQVLALDPVKTQPEEAPRMVIRMRFEEEEERARQIALGNDLWGHA